MKIKVTDELGPVKPKPKKRKKVRPLRLPEDRLKDIRHVKLVDVADMLTDVVAIMDSEEFIDLQS